MDNNVIGGILAVIVLAGGIYAVSVTGNELTCRAGNGWTIIADHGSYVEAACEYTSKAWVYANCTPQFRATSTYQYYGCQEVSLAYQGPGDSGNQQSQSPCIQQICDLNGCNCVG